jgi:hypothetical protein
MFDKEAHTLSDAQIAKIIQYAPVIEKFLKNVKAEVVMRAERGQTVEGVKIVDGRASYDWAIPEDKLLKVFKKLGVPKECWHEHEVLSPNKLKNLTWQDKDGNPDGLTSEQVELVYREYVKKVPGYPTVVPENDKRKPKDFAAAGELDNLFKQANSKE